MNFRKTLLAFILFFFNLSCMAPVRAEAAEVKETVYNYQRIDNYQLGKRGRITGWKWEKKKRGLLIGTRYRWGRKGKEKKIEIVKIQHPYIEDMLYGEDLWWHKPGVTCDYSFVNTKALLTRQFKKRMYFILPSLNGYSYLVTKRNGTVVYARKISFYEVEPGASSQNISDMRVMGKNKLLITYQIKNKEDTSFAKSGICYLNVKTGQKQIITMDTEKYYPLLCDGTHILAFTAEPFKIVKPVRMGMQKEEPKIVLLSCKNGKVLRKIAIPDTKLPKEADETNSKKYKVWICGKKVYYLDNIGGIYVCKIKSGKFKRLPGTYRYVKYNYPMDNYEGIIFKKGKKTVFCVDYLTYGEDEHFEFGEADQYKCIVRYDIL